MKKSQKRRRVISRLRNNFIAGVVVLIPIGITVYLTLFIIKISSKILPKELNPNQKKILRTIASRFRKNLDEAHINAEIQSRKKF